MPWCPSCGNEHERGFERCADCGVALVEARPARNADAGAGIVPFVFESEALAERVAGLLASLGIPFARPPADDAWRIVVGAPYASNAVDAIDRAFADLVTHPGEGFVEVRAHDPKADAEIRDHPILRAPFERVRADGAAAREALRSCAVWGSRAVRERARALLLRLGEDGVAELGSAFVEAVDAKDAVAAAEALHVLGADAEKRTTPWPEPIASVAALVAASDPFRRKWGILAAGRLRLRGAIAGLADLVESGDPEVADAADEALCEITGEDLGFDRAAPPEEVARIAALWRKRADAR